MKGWFTGLMRTKVGPAAPKNWWLNAMDAAKGLEARRPQAAQAVSDAWEIAKIVNATDNKERHDRIRGVRS